MRVFLLILLTVTNITASHSIEREKEIPNYIQYLQKYVHFREFDDSFKTEETVKEAKILLKKYHIAWVEHPNGINFTQPNICGFVKYPSKKYMALKPLANEDVILSAAAVFW